MEQRESRPCTAEKKKKKKEKEKEKKSINKWDLSTTRNLGGLKPILAWLMRDHNTRRRAN